VHPQVWRLESRAASAVTKAALRDVKGAIMRKPDGADKMPATRERGGAREMG
jgi:hypothetical protein